MEHGFLDQYSDLNSFIHELDVRIKLVTTLAFILAVILVSPANWWAFAAYFVLISILILLSRLPLLYVLKRSLVIVPFVLIVALFIPFFKPGHTLIGGSIWQWHIAITEEGLTAMWSVLAKAWLSMLSLILLSSTTRVVNLLKGMEQLGAPRVIVMTISFMYRYIFVLVDELMRMRRARDSRNFGGKWDWKMQTIGNMIGVLFVRSYERGERVYQAMAARGFEGQVRTLTRLRIRGADWCFGALFLLSLAAIGAYRFFI